MPVKAVLFDFDGTLVETRTASWELFEETNREFSLGLDTREKFFQIFEGNFFHSLIRHCHDEALATAAATHFMESVRTRYNPAFIPGIVQIVRVLAVDLTLGILSSNMQETIRRILLAGGVAGCFSHILAGDLERCKSTAIKRFLDGTWDPNPPDGEGDRRYRSGVRYTPAEVVVVTDTVGDVGEALACGVDVYGVNWGMHSEQQLLDAGAGRVAREPQELLEWLDAARGAVAAAQVKSPA